MRKINKQTSLSDFDGSHYKECRDWNCFHDNYKDIFQEARLQILIYEQNTLCGYTEIYINNEEESHIDHYIKRSHNSNLTFDWSNLVVATKDNDFGANFKDNQYNNGDGIQQEEYQYIYNPVSDDINFRYTEWGEIIEEDGKIKKTVEVFNLNHESLKRRREGLITTVRALKNDLSSDEIMHELDTAGFLSVIEQELGLR